MERHSSSSGPVAILTLINRDVDVQSATVQASTQKAQHYNDRTY